MEVWIAKDPKPDNSKQDLPFAFYCPVCHSLLNTKVGDYNEDNGAFYVSCPVCGVRLYKSN